LFEKNRQFCYPKKGDKMPIRGNGIRVGALILLIALAGAFCFSTWASEPKTNKIRDTDKTARSVAGPGSDNGPGVLEQEQAQPLAKIARKHFPWLWVVAGAVVAGVVLYFTVIKKPEYKLNVSMGPGVSGYPVAGAFVYKKGKKVRYLYSLGYGYRALKVMLDGKEVEASGEFTMDRDHVLVVSSEEQFYDLTVNLSTGVTGTPAAGTYSYKMGSSVAYNYAETSGYTNLKVQVDDVEVAAQGTVLMDRAHTLAAVAKQFDVRGTWRITASDDYFSPTQEVIFTGSPETGKVYRSDGIFVLGDYHVTWNDIRFWIFVEDVGGSQWDGSSFTGTIRDMDNMGGTCTRYICDGCGYANGGWSAVRVR
jgi:hypothetical protein